MKKFVYVLLIIICLFGFTWTVNAQETQRQYQITWEDNNVKTIGFKWHIFMSDQSGVYDINNPVLIVPIADAIVENGGFKTIGSIELTGLPGSKITKYFVMQSENETDKSILSEEAIGEFPIPLNPPYGVKVIFIIKGE